MSLPTPAERGQGQRPHVLIVSDDLGLRLFLGEGLLLAGFWTSAIASALQVLEVFRLRSFDLVLVDAGLAGIGGLELVRRLRGRSGRAGAPRTDVPILLVTDDPATLDPAVAREAGADGVVAAPIELADLAPRLSDVVYAWRAAHPGRPFADAATLDPGRGGGRPTTASDPSG
ncbi:MAG: response regulator [Chloroflexota bacterium]|nr:response regulator [Chloroflexota bacterium]